MLNEKLYRKVLRWDELPEEALRPGVRRRSYSSDNCMLVMNTLEPKMQLNPHVHDDFDQLVYIVDGECNYFVDDEPHHMTTGSMMLVPAGSPHYIEPLNGPCLNLDIFTPPRADLMHLVSYLTDDAAPASPPA